MNIHPPRWSAISRRLFAGLLACASLAAASVPASAAWRPAVDLGPNSQGSPSSVANDATGRFVAAWSTKCAGASCTRIVARFRDLSGNWGPTEIVRDGVNGAADVQVRTSVSGGTTVAWIDANGISTSDKTNSGWQVPVQLSTIGYENFKLVGNSSGDLALVWAEGGYNASHQVRATVRPARTAWSPVQTVAASGSRLIQLDDAAISLNGDVVAATETYDRICNGKCHNYNFELRAARRAVRGNAAWAQSPRLDSIGVAHGASVALDDNGHAGVVSNSSSTGVLVFTQAGAGAPWSAGVTVIASTGAYPDSADAFASDAAGNATIAVRSGEYTKVETVSGSIVMNTWGAPIVVQTGQEFLGILNLTEAPDGRAVLSWDSQGPFITGYTSLRPTLHGAWSTPTRLDPIAYWETQGPDASAVVAGGDAVVVYSQSRTDNTTIREEFAKSYH